MKLFWVFLGCWWAVAAQAGAADPRPDMHVLAKEILALEKFLVSDAEFANPANEGAIRKSLGSMDAHIGHLGEGAFADDPALRVNLSLLKQQVKDAQRSFTEGAKPFARYMLQSSLQLCIACHTRKKAPEFAWPEVEGEGISPRDKAEYYFATRQFEKGRAVHEALVAGYPGNQLSPWDLQKSLTSLAVYYARVKEDPAAGARYFAQAGEQEALPIYLRQQLQAWAEEFRAWSKEKPANNKGAGEKELLAGAKKLLKQDDLSLVREAGRSFHIRRLRAGALLHRLLESPGPRSPLKAEALLYLGQLYARINANIFFRFGDLYLKACIAEYPKTAEARACYVALEASVMEGFSGSGGTSVPEDEQVELVRLKRLAY